MVRRGSNEINRNCGKDNNLDFHWVLVQDAAAGAATKK